MEKWRMSWRSFVHLLPTDGLLRLERALETDDPKLQQGSFVTLSSQGKVKSVCAISYCFWRGKWNGKEIRGDSGINKVLQEVGIFNEGVTIALTDNFVSWFDGGPRTEIFRQLLPEVKAEIARRFDKSEEEVLREEKDEKDPVRVADGGLLD